MITRFDSFNTAGEDGWNRHPAFEGVYLKAVVTGGQSNNMFSAHLVRIEPGCAIGLHDHPGHWELHEVLEGHGSCELEDAHLEYAPGVCEVMPQGRPHTVSAGEKGLKLLAKFVPALV
ncbi:cupin domain-containing protein [Salidesulfovibrio onnuriiensis]|uniref:cupin domain-containing protein n=1 Tax=Salidesulfovibrio onnuriiensis TaxID=2583823 RepID=UPI0011CBADA8|nr:cupin domain-containing protein [Salidesulfovibrio onnuriiensis]